MSDLLGKKVVLLDHGFVRLTNFMGGDVDIARAARVSYDAEWRAGMDEGSDHRLIHYLMSHRHTTSFEAVELQFEVKAPIFVFRQWHRHRTWSYNELSARYRELPEEFYVPEPGAVGEQATANKQGRQESAADRTTAISDYTAQCESAFALYRRLLGEGWPRELARACLPVSTYSHMFAKTNLHNFFHFAGLRADPHAQMEIRVYAEAMVELARSVAPVAVAAWEANRA